MQLAETEADQRAAQSEAVRAQELQTKVSALEQQLAETRASTRAAQAEVTEVQRLRGTDVERMQGTIHELESQLSQTVAGESAARAQAERDGVLAARQHRRRAARQHRGFALLEALHFRGREHRGLAVRQVHCVGGARRGVRERVRHVQGVERGAHVERGQG